MVRRDADGWYWFVGRSDDVIETAGHLVGPFEVEGVLMAHPAVEEVAVVGTRDPIAGRLVKAFVVVPPEHEAGADLADELMAFTRARLGSVAPAGSSSSTSSRRHERQDRPTTASTRLRTSTSGWWCPCTLLDAPRTGSAG